MASISRNALPIPRNTVDPTDVDPAHFFELVAIRLKGCLHRPYEVPRPPAHGYQSNRSLASSSDRAP